MRTVAVLSLLLGAALAAPVRAQAPDVTAFGPGLTQTTPATPPRPLPIPLPPGVAVQMEMDGQDADLLGMVKSLLAGAATRKTGAGANAAAGPDANPFLSFLGDGQLTALLKDIHHLHVLSFKPIASAAPTDFLAFYEQPFEAQGGHRLLYVSGVTPVVTVGFDQPRGFAAVVQSSGTVFVMRADGYPDMTVIGSLLRTFGSAIPKPLTGVTPAPTSPAPPAHKATPKTPHAKARRA